MAGMTNDSQLLGLCGTGDLYEHLAVQLLGDATYRDTVKRMFLAYSYGMTAQALADYLIDCGVTKDEANKIIATRFVPLFSGVEEWKDSVSATLFSSGRVSTVLGNNRYRAKKGELDRKEKRWAISQKIQGTGSLILKKAIIKIRKNLPEALILLPMHDALLLEVPSKLTGELTHELLNYFREAFLSVCPTSFASVRQKRFVGA
jgi:DNA polymerase I-like protein with 3'-5' exonuclease and polymerase domains